MYDRILVPVDGSPTSEAGLLEAVRLARLSGGHIRLMHVVDELPFVPEAAVHGVVDTELATPALDRAAEMLQAWRARVGESGVQVDTMLIEGAGAHLVGFVNDQVKAWKADIVVLGTHGRSGIGRTLIGSDAEQIVRHATVPVLLVRCATKAASSEGESVDRTAQVTAR
jgi:nucleotide-binding universal stress UspA family protein